MPEYRWPPVKAATLKTVKLVPLGFNRRTFAEAEPFGPDEIEGTFIEALIMQSRERSVADGFNGLNLEAAKVMVAVCLVEVENYWQAKGRQLEVNAESIRLIEVRFAENLPKDRHTRSMAWQSVITLLAEICSNSNMTLNIQELAKPVEPGASLMKEIKTRIDFINFITEPGIHDRLFPLYNELYCLRRVLDAIQSA